MCELNTDLRLLQPLVYTAYTVKASFHFYLPSRLCYKRNSLFAININEMLRNWCCFVGDHVKRCFLYCLVAYSNVHLFLLLWPYADGCHYPESLECLRGNNWGGLYLTYYFSSFSLKLFPEKGQVKRISGQGEGRPENTDKWLSQDWGRSVPGAWGSISRLKERRDTV